MDMVSYSVIQIELATRDGSFAVNDVLVRSIEQGPINTADDVRLYADRTLANIKKLVPNVPMADIFNHNPDLAMYSSDELFIRKIITHTVGELVFKNALELRDELKNAILKEGGYVVGLNMDYLTLKSKVSISA